MKSNQLHIPEKREILAAALRATPDHGLWTIAKAVFKKHPRLWSNVQAVRCALARLTIGEAGRRKPHPEFARAKRAPGYLPIPESRAQPWAPLELQPSRTLVLSDIHIPYHDAQALQEALRCGDKFKPDCVLLNGDAIDFYSISRHQKNPELRDLTGELAALRQFLQHLSDRYPRAHIVLKKGNHEERWDHYIWNHAPDFAGLPEFKLEAVLHTADYSVDVVSDQRIIFIGRLPVLHGHEFPKGLTNPVNPARGYFLRGQETILAGHLHRSSEHTEQSMLDRFVTVWSTGCLCDLHPEYARINRWNHGFAMVECRPSGEFHVHNQRVRNGVML